MVLSRQERYRLERFFSKTFVSVFRVHYGVGEGTISHKKKLRDGKEIEHLFVPNNDVRNMLIMSAVKILESDGRNNAFVISMSGIREGFGMVGLMGRVRFVQGVPKICPYDSDAPEELMVLTTFEVNDCYPGTEIPRMDEHWYGIKGYEPYHVMTEPAPKELSPEIEAEYVRQKGRLM